MKVRIEIDVDGTMQISVNGAKGKRCKDITADLEKLGTVTSEKKTSEFYEKEEKGHVRSSNRS